MKAIIYICTTTISLYELATNLFSNNLALAISFVDSCATTAMTILRDYPKVKLF